MEDDLTPEREIHVIGRIPASKHFIDLEFEMITNGAPLRPGKIVEMLDTIVTTWKELITRTLLRRL